MMSKTESQSSPGAHRPGSVAADGVAPVDADWRQIEELVEQLHELARAPISSQDFYRRLLDGCVTLLAAQGGTVWSPVGPGRWQATYRINSERVLDSSEVSDQAAHLALLQRAAAAARPLIVPPRSRSALGIENPSSAVLVLAAVAAAGGLERDDRTEAIVELTLQPGSSPAAQQGWQELLKTVCQVASEFHLYEQLRTLGSERQFYDQSLALIRRLQQSRDLRQTAFEIANEGRRFVAADRLSLILQRGRHWQLLAASGVDSIESRSDAAKRLQALATATAAWGEPLEYTDAPSAAAGEWPPELAELLARHVDESQARRLVAVPIEFAEPGDRETISAARPSRIAAVLIAEQFSYDAGEFSRQRVLELAGLCEPALRQAKRFDRFPVRNCLRWADRWARICEAWGFTRLTVAVTAALAALAALIFVPCDFEVEAPATLRPLVERDIFATTDGKVVDVRIAHGQQVEAGDALAVLHDPQLSLDAERVQGEIKTTRKRLEAIAVARTDRKVREDVSGEKLPLAAEAEQLARRLDSLQTQQEILTRRRESLTLRSPIAGTVLTLDVQNLLLTRPVERGQVLFTVADTSAGWRLLADMPQDRIGQVVAAQRQSGPQLAARFRLRGDTDQTYLGHVESISTAAVLDTAGLNQESHPFEIVIAVDQRSLATARPGMSAEVRIDCGRRSLGYVWLHDIWENLYSWFVF